MFIDELKYGVLQVHYCEIADSKMSLLGELKYCHIRDERILYLAKLKNIEIFAGPTIYDDCDSRSMVPPRYDQHCTEHDVRM